MCRIIKLSNLTSIRLVKLTAKVHTKFKAVGQQHWVGFATEEQHHDDAYCHYISKCEGAKKNKQQAVLKKGPGGTKRNDRVTCFADAHTI